MKKEVTNLEELRLIADTFLCNVTEKAPKGKAAVVALSGDLGAGKTAFVKCIAKALGIPDVITSPTFILEKVYIIPRESVVHGRFTKLIHIDAYRLDRGEEMNALDWKSLILDENNLIFIEWPEKVKDVVPEDAHTLSFEYVSEWVRSITGDLI